MGFRYKGKGIPKRSISASIARTIPEFLPAIFRCFTKMVDIRNEVIALLFHQCINARLKFFVHKFPHFTAKFIKLGSKEGYDMLVIGPIANMIIYKHIWIKCMKDLSKCPGVF